jgi:hypothetical protein
VIGFVLKSMKNTDILYLPASKLLDDGRTEFTVAADVYALGMIGSSPQMIDVHSG